MTTDQAADPPPGSHEDPGSGGAVGDGERQAEPGERALDGLEHLQAAARELIQAARAVLDVAEELVEDPDTVRTTFSTLGTFLRDAARPFTAPSRHEEDDRDGAGPSRVERIDLD